MPLLTEVALESFQFTVYVDWQTSARGRDYYREGRVTIDRFDGESAICPVRGTHGEYTVSLVAEGKKKIRMTCDCPQAADRAHRIGQDKPVFIYKYIARD